MTIREYLAYFGLLHYAPGTIKLLDEVTAGTNGISSVPLELSCIDKSDRFPLVDLTKDERAYFEKSQQYVSSDKISIYIFSELIVAKEHDDKYCMKLMMCITGYIKLIVDNQNDGYFSVKGRQYDVINNIVYTKNIYDKITEDNFRVLVENAVTKLFVKDDMVSWFNNPKVVKQDLSLSQIRDKIDIAGACIFMINKKFSNFFVNDDELLVKAAANSV